MPKFPAVIWKLQKKKKTYDEMCDWFNPPSQQTFLNQSFDFSVEMLNKYKVSDLASLMGTAYGLVIWNCDCSIKINEKILFLKEWVDKTLVLLNEVRLHWNIINSY